MLMDVLGVLIAFVAVVLLLSIVVTAMGQLTQSILKLRGRNLISGVSALLQLTSAEREGKPVAAQNPHRARQLLNTIEAGNLKPAKDPNSLFSRALGPTVSWIDQPTFVQAAQAIGHQIENSSSLTQHFRIVGAAMEKRFLLRMRIVSGIWAMMIAFVFQVSAPEYLRDLWSNPQARRQVEAMASQLLSDSQEALATFDHFENAAPAALERLAEKYPASRETIEQAGGVGTTKAFIVDELRLVLESDPQREPIIADYERFLDEERLQYADDLATAASRASTSLASMYIEPWSRRWAYYTGPTGLHWRHLGGVFITALLLVLGAPFWFNVLKSLVNLCDTMKSRLTS